MRFISVFATGLLLVFHAYPQSPTTKDSTNNKSGPTITEKISGQWELDHMVDVEKKKKENNGAQTSNGMQLIEFASDSRYKMNNPTTSVDSGSYTLNEQTSTLILQSDLTDNTPSEWTVGFKNKGLVLTPNDESSKRYQYHYTKSKQKTGKKRNKK